MKDVANKIFGSVVAGALALTPMAAFAGEAANSNASIATAPAATMTVQYIGAQDRTINDARTLAADASHNKVAIVVWGGNQTIQQEAYNAALDLVDMGIPTAFVLAPDHNGLSEEAVLQVYAASTPRSDGHMGTNNAHLIREDMREAGIAAYREAFPQQVAALSLK